MDPQTFKDWRKGLGLKQKEAAEKLGLKKRVIQYYEKGARDGKKVEIPKSIELACLALALGYESYDGRAINGASTKHDQAGDDEEALAESVIPLQAGTAGESAEG